jgi:hypothetical protein
MKMPEEPMGPAEVEKPLDLQELNALLEKKDPFRDRWHGIALQGNGIYMNPAAMKRSGFACMVRHLANDTTVVTAFRKRGPKLHLSAIFSDDAVSWERILEGFAYKNNYRTAIVSRGDDYYLIVGKTETRKGPLIRKVGAVKMRVLPKREAEMEEREYYSARMAKIEHEARGRALRGDLEGLLESLKTKVKQ